MLNVKQSQTFAFHATITGRDGALVELSNYQVSSQIREALGNEVASLKSRLPTGRPGIVNLWSDTGIVDWPTGRLFCDLHFIRQNGVIQFIETFSIIVATPITRP